MRAQHSTHVGSSSEELDSFDDMEFQQQLLNTFLQEFEELMDLYKNGLNELRKINGDVDQAYKDFFRIYHTLKGDSGYFPEFEEFTKFSSHYCERLRDLDDNVKNDMELRQEIRLNFTRLSGALSALNNGKSLQAFRFKLFLKNF